ncbi:ABC transporter substrate-binding protein [Snuella sedimenti]|uniref:Carbohydrate ABC transporter substrate-binding protein n=1 Tax=Snuella sedimenti TaxID=2798802 RepID=A0A8J7JAJ3_9FLAO|nr:ABC transporter substrate-binding protein [Snuella sedimenti]MBJ6367474.1 carbohydrate ABC transporter substrate-binding protein [Snuella sedimenti]
MNTNKASNIIELKGIAWDHPRGYEPLRATSKEFSTLHPEVSIAWDIRSLKEFGDTPIEDLIDTYDLITIDHPYMGQAHVDQLLLPLEGSLLDTFLKALETQSVGPSFKSYYYKGHLYALPIDAAALVAAAREDLITKIHVELPKTRADLFRFYKRIPKEYSVAWPLCATDLWCSFLSLCAQDAGRNFIKNGTIDEKTGINVLDELKKHLQYLHPESINWNPIQVLDHMASSDHIIYAPFVFGYTNYSREGYAKNRVCFGNSPTNPKTNVSTILGGVGLAISSKSRHANWAVAFASYVANAQTQQGTYTNNGGQPGNLVAWQDESNNRLCHHFFKDILKTMQKAYVRPQHPGWNQFQEQGAELLHKGIQLGTASEKLVKDLNELYRAFRGEGNRGTD